LFNNQNYICYYTHEAHIKITCKFKILHVSRFLVNIFEVLLPIACARNFFCVFRNCTLLSHMVYLRFFDNNGILRVNHYKSLAGEGFMLPDVHVLSLFLFFNYWASLIQVWVTFNYLLRLFGVIKISSEALLDRVTWFLLECSKFLF
jgi:hypothetical protein